MEGQIRNNVKPVKVSYTIDLKYVRLFFHLYWHWIIASIFVCILIGLFYLWITPTTVDVTGKMQFVESNSNKSGGSSAGAAMLNSLPFGLGSSFGSSLGLGGGSAAKIETEMEVLLSNTLIRDVVNNLELHTEYRLCSLGRKDLLYHNNPLSVKLDPAHQKWFDDELPMNYHQIDLYISYDSGRYTVETTIKENGSKFEVPDQVFDALPAVIKTDVGTLTISDNELSPKHKSIFGNDYTLKVTIKPSLSVAEDFVSRLVVEPASKKVVDVLKISLSDENVNRGVDFLKNLMKSYNQRANDEKNEEARKTDEFVSKRLVMLDSELGTSDAAWESSKEHHQITMLEVDAEEVMTKKSLYEIQLVEIGTQLQLHDFLSEYVNDPANLYEIIPSGITHSYSSSSSSATSTSSSSSSSSSSSGSVAGTSPGTMSLFSQHNSLINQRNDYLKSMSEKSPQVQRVTETIRELHPTIVTAMKRDRQQIIMRENAIRREYSRYMGRASSTPKMERELTDIARQREIKQGVYLSMLQKREEIAMELANTTDKGKFVDEPMVIQNSKKPKKKNVLLIAILVGFILPISIIELRNSLKSKIVTRDGLEKLTKKEVVGDIPIFQNEDAIRALRTNLLLKLTDNQKVIAVTSYSIGEGKSFITSHLVKSLKNIGKKVELINADPENQDYSSVPSYMSPSDYFACVDFAKRIEEAKQSSDYVIIDCVTTSKGPDIYQIAQYADATLFVVRAEVTDSSAVENLSKETRLPHLMLVLNAIDMTKKKYKFIYDA